VEDGRTTKGQMKRSIKKGKWRWMVMRRNFGKGKWEV